MHVRLLVRQVLSAIVLCVLAACGQSERNPAQDVTSLDNIAQRYVRLGLALGEHDADYVDAYYGPADWREQVRAEALPLADIHSRAQQLATDLNSVPEGETQAMHRRTYLQKQVEAMLARIDMLEGKKLPFDVESQRVFDAVAPTHDAAYFDTLLGQLDVALPGSGSIGERYTEFRKRFVIPPAQLDAVFKRAVAGCRERTLRQIPLPENETFTIEYVKDKPWSGYNWYQGGFRSLIQVNTDLPVYIDRALDLACHEGYPGHHVYNVLLEKNMVQDRQWMEFTINPLFAPQSLIAEGSANYGIELAFPDDERWRWEQVELFPLAGLDPAEAQNYYRVIDLARQLGYAGNEAARSYLDGRIGADDAAHWLERYALMSPEHARQRLAFIEKYRAYVINYNLGQDMVKVYVEAGAGGDAARRWQVFAGLLSSPHVPSQLLLPRQAE